MTEHNIDISQLRFNIEQGGHSVFSPSFSAAWLWCSGSLLPNLLAKDGGSEDAAYGTVGHSVGEEWLKTGERPDYRLSSTVIIEEGDNRFEVVIDHEMIEYVSQYVVWCRDLPGDHYVEKRVYFSEITPIPKQGGTADHFACEHKKLTITDLKLGQGVMVFAAEDLSDPRWGWRDAKGEIHINGNTQAMLYALGAIFEYDWMYGFEEIVIRIAQPRLGHFQTWTTTKAEILAFADWAKVRALAAWQPDAPRRASIKACRWCKITATCPAVVAIAHELADGTFDDLDAEITSTSVVTVDPAHLSTLPQVNLLTTEQMAKLLPFRSMFEKWFNAIDAELESRALAGEQVPGMKLVESRSFRRWTDEEHAADKLGERLGRDLYKTTIISPAQAEGVLMKTGLKKKEAEKIVAPLVSKPPGKPTLAPISDSRERLGAAADQCFDDLDDPAFGL